MPYGTVGGVWTESGGGINSDRLKEKGPSEIKQYVTLVKDLIAVGQDDAAFDTLMSCPCISKEKRMEHCEFFFPYLVDA